MAVDAAALIARSGEGTGSMFEVLCAVLDRLPVGVALLVPVEDGQDFRYAYANAVYETLMPGSPVVGSTYRSMWPEWADAALPRLAEVFDTGVTSSDENRSIRVEIEPGRQETRYFSFEISRLDVSGMRMVLDRFIETTAEVESVRSLRKSEERLRALVEASSDVVYQMTADWSVMRQLRSRTYLAETKEANPQWLQEYIPASDQPMVTRAIAEAIESKRVFDLEHRVIRADGGLAWTHSRAVPMFNERGEITEWFGYASDITERVEAQEERERLLQTERESSRYNAALNEIDAAVTSTIDVEKTLETVLADAATAVGADVGALFMPLDGEWEARHTWRAPEWLRGLRVREADIPFSVIAARHRRTDLFTKPSRTEGWEDSVARRLDAQDVLDAPLNLGDGQTGDLTLYKLHGDHPTEAARDFLQKASVSVSLALQNARRFQREHDVAETLQTALLSLPDAMPGVEFAHAYHSASEAARVGGDFYDIFELSSNSVAVIVGDVAGKGLRASALTSLVRNAIRAHASEKGAVPARIVELTNKLVFESTPAESFVTVFFGVIDIEADHLTYANAGHTTGALVGKDGNLTPLPATGPVVGAFADASVDQAECRFDAGTTLFLYTDGLTEARHGSELFGEERVFELLAHIHSGDPTRLVRGTIDEVLRFAGGSLNDDLALFAVRRIQGRQSVPAKRFEL